MEKVRGGLGKFGMAMPAGDDVEVKGPLGVKMQVTYREKEKELDLAITDKPIFVTENQIWKVIESTAGKYINNGK